MHNEPKYPRLGKLAARRDPRTFSLSNYLRADALPAAPSALSFTSKVAKWPMMDNDRLGDCTCAAAGHMIEQWTTYSGRAFTPTDSEIVAAYSAAGGYDPATGQNDNGCVVQDVLNLWRKTGVAGHKINAYVGLEPKNHMHVKDSIYLFGNVYIGVGLPISAQGQTEWAVPPNGPVGVGAPGSWGGHAVPIVAYDQRGLTVVTWGALKRMSWGFLDTYCDEAYAVLSEDWISATKHVTPESFDFKTLQADIQQLSVSRLVAA